MRTADLRIPELWRTTTFRLTTLYGAVFALGVVALLGLVYWRTASQLTARVDAIVSGETAALARLRPDVLPDEIRRDAASAALRLNAYALFSEDGAPVAGNVAALPPELRIGGPPQDVSPSQGFRSYARAMAVRLPWGEVLVVGRDTSQIRQLRGFILVELVWSGALIAGIGLASGVALSLAPLRRLRDLQAASHRIVGGDLSARMPIAGRRDELDLFAGMVNGMIEEVERLLVEAKSANDSVAHDLRTPLSRVRSLLARLSGSGGLNRDQQGAVDQATAELDLTLDRFRALLRISEIEAQARRAGFRPVDVGAVLRQVMDLYEPLAEAREVRLTSSIAQASPVEADDKLLFEAVSNLVDNAIKFSPVGASVEIALETAPQGLRIVVGDRGPGIDMDERQAVLERFYRGAAAGPVAGSGLGLSIVAAIARLHRFELELGDNAPGVRAVLLRPTPSP